MKRKVRDREGGRQGKGRLGRRERVSSCRPDVRYVHTS